MSCTPYIQRPDVPPYKTFSGREPDATGIPGSAGILGYAGVIPFAACTALLAWGDPAWQPMVLEAFMIYSAVILSFIGGIRWGAAFTGNKVRGGAFAISVIPSLWAAFFLWWPGEREAMWGLMTGFALMGLADWLRPAFKMPAWMRPLRIRLTAAVLACHMAVVTLL